MEDILFSIFPNKNFIDLGLYQYGWEHCSPAHSFGPSSRNHYLFHYVISGSGTLMANDSKGVTQTYQIKSGQGFLIFPKQTPFHLIGHLFLFWDYFTRSSKSKRLFETSKMSDYYIKEAINFIEQNFQNDISIEEIAEVCGINRSYLGKIFKKNVGKSPQEFLMNYRMVKATELLKLTDLSIADIGKAVSYENQLHFSRAFKTILGISPRHWRKQNK